MTEAEAMEKYCCKPGAENDIRLQGCCVGSKCMAWQWVAWKCGDGCGITRTGTIENKYREPCEPPDQPQFYARLGRCGLAR